MRTLASNIECATGVQHYPAALGKTTDEAQHGAARRRNRTNLHTYCCCYSATNMFFFFLLLYMHLHAAAAVDAILKMVLPLLLLTMP